MKHSNEGIIRAVDKQGRVVIPMEMRKRYGIDLGDPIEFFTDNGSIVLKKYDPSCVFCGSEKNVVSFQGRMVCSACMKGIGQALESKPPRKKSSKK